MITPEFLRNFYNSQHFHKIYIRKIWSSCYGYSHYSDLVKKIPAALSTHHVRGITLKSLAFFRLKCLRLSLSFLNKRALGKDGRYIKKWTFAIHLFQVVALRRHKASKEKYGRIRNWENVTFWQRKLYCFKFCGYENVLIRQMEFTFTFLSSRFTEAVVRTA